MNNKLNGIINFNKPAGITSHDAVYLIRKFTGIKKVGHTGTLDPMATGVLPICIGKATRIIEYLDLDNSKDAKVYSCEMTLGISSETYDIWGDQLVKDSFLGISEEQIKETLLSFVGDIEQIPPMYSAIKVDGKKLYDYARNGESLDPSKLRPRAVSISRIDIISINIQTGKIHFEMACSKGTYVRSLCHDVGQILGCGAVLSALERTSSNGFTIDTAYTEKDLIALKDLSTIVFPMDKAIAQIPMLILDSVEARADFINGRTVKLQENSENSKPGLHRIYYGKDEFLGIAMLEGTSIFPKKVIADLL